MKPTDLSAYELIQFLNARRGWHGNQYRTLCGQWLAKHDKPKGSPQQSGRPVASYPAPDEPGLLGEFEQDPLPPEQHGFQPTQDLCSHEGEASNEHPLDPGACPKYCQWCGQAKVLYNRAMSPLWLCDSCQSMDQAPRPQRG